MLINSRSEPYWRDVPDLIARQSGSGFYFRYESDLIPAQILNALPELEGKEGFVVHINTPAPPDPVDAGAQLAPSSSATSPYEYLPVRSCRVTTVERYGRYIRVNFLLGSLVSHPDRKAPGPNAYDATVREAISASGARPGYQGDYVVSATIPDLPLDDTMSNWNNVTSELARFPSFTTPRPTIFLRTEWQEPPPPAKRNLLRWLVPNEPPTFDADGRLVLKGGRGYRLHVIESVPYRDADHRRVPLDRTKFPVSLTLQSDGTILTPVIPSTTIRGMYDDGYYDLQCETVANDTYSFLSLSSDAKDFNVSEVRLDEVLVTSSTRTIVLAGVIAGLFILGAFVSPILSFLSGHGVATSQDWAPWFTGALDGVAGVIIVFLGAWIK